MNNWTVRYIFAAVDKMSPVFKKMKTNLAKLQSSLKKTGMQMQKFGKSMKYYSVAAAAGLGLMLRGAAKLETMETSFLGIMGSAEKAKNMVAELNDFTARTPFQLEAVARAAQGLMPLMAQEDVMKGLQMVGDVASATGRNLADVMLPYQKAMATNKVQGEVLNMLAEKGIPILQVFAKQFGTTAAGVYELGAAGKITSDNLKEAFRTMTSEGGFAYQGMINQSKTLSGLWSTLKDNFGLTAAVFGDQMLPAAKKLANKLIDITASMRAWAKANPAMAKLAVILLGIVAVMAPLLIMLGKIAVGIVFLAPAFAALSWPIVLIIAGVTALIAVLVALYMNFDKIRNFFTNTRLGGLIKAAFDYSPLGFFVRMLKETYTWAVKVADAISNLNVVKHGKKALGLFKEDVGKAWDWMTGDIESQKQPAQVKSGGNGSLSGNININNNTGYDVTSDVKSSGVAKGVGVNMGQALGAM